MKTDDGFQPKRICHSTWPDTSGVNSRTAKFTEDEIREIRTSPLTAVALAEKYGVHVVTIRKIRRRKTYGSVSDE